MNKHYIVTHIDYDTKFKSEDEIADLNFKMVNALGIWCAYGKEEHERINCLWEKVEQYMGTRLKSLEYEKNRPHALTSFM